MLELIYLQKTTPTIIKWVPSDKYFRLLMTRTWALQFLDKV